MKRIGTIFLQAVLVALGLGVLAFMLWEPHLEGRNVNATLFEIYFKDPFLAYAYASSISFFVALYQAFKVLGYMRQDKIFSQEAVRALRTIKYCALLLIALIGAGVAYIFIFMRGKDDIAGGVALGLFMILVSSLIASGAAVFGRVVQNGVDMRSQNDLMV